MELYSYVRKMQNQINDNFFQSSDKQEVDTYSMPNVGLYQSETTDVKLSM